MSDNPNPNGTTFIRIADDLDAEVVVDQIGVWIGNDEHGIQFSFAHWERLLAIVFERRAAVLTRLVTP